MFLAACGKGPPARREPISHHQGRDPSLPYHSTTDFTSPYEWTIESISSSSPQVSQSDVAARLDGVGAGLDAQGLTAVVWVSAGTACFFVAFRLYVRWREAGGTFADDYWIIAALAVLIVNAVLQTVQTESLYYISYVSAGLLPADAELMRQGNIYVRYEFPIIGLMWTVLWTVKASFLALFWRLFDGLPHYRRLWWVVTIFAFLAYVGCWIGSAWTCHPPSIYFTFGKCTKPIDQVGSVISISYSTAVDILTDLLIMSLPIRLLGTLRVTKRQKVGLVVVFCLGFCIIAVAIVRLTQIVGSARTDPVGLAVWGIVESSVAVIVGSLPPLKSFLDKRMQKYTQRMYAYGRRDTTDPRSGGYSGAISGGARSPFASATSKQGGLNVRTESIPLEEATYNDHGQIIVQKEFGWVNLRRQSGLGAESFTESDHFRNANNRNGDEKSDEVRIMDEEVGECCMIDAASKTSRRENLKAKTSWLQQ